MSLTTTKPSEELKAKFEASVGNLRMKTFRTLVSGPLLNKVFAKISFSSRQRDAYVNSQVDKFPQFFWLTQQFGLNKIEQGDINTDSLRGTL